MLKIKVIFKNGKDQECIADGEETFVEFINRMVLLGGPIKRIEFVD